MGDEHKIKYLRKTIGRHFFKIADATQTFQSRKSSFNLVPTYLTCFTVIWNLVYKSH